MRKLTEKPKSRIFQSKSQGPVKNPISNYDCIAQVNKLLEEFANVQKPER